MKRTAFIAFIGRPNVGKSTLLNAILGEKVAIVSKKPQTTRNRITGIHTVGEDQMVFLDTPGIHRPKNKLGDYMVKAANASMRDADAVIHSGNEVDDRNFEPVVLEEFVVLCPFTVHDAANYAFDVNQADLFAYVALVKKCGARMRSDVTDHAKVVFTFEEDFVTLRLYVVQHIDVVFFFF